MNLIPVPKALYAVALVAAMAAPSEAVAQICPPPSCVPGTAELYGVHETQVRYPLALVVNPFRDLSLFAFVTSPTGRMWWFYNGFYDGDGAGGMGTFGATNTVWRIRWMPDEVGTWNISWGFSDGVGIGSGSFSVTDTGIPGPPKHDPDNWRLMVDARGNAIHWRGYSIKHVGDKICCDPPLALSDATAMIDQVIEPYLVNGGYNATYVSVPTGWPAGTCNPTIDQSNCPIWGDYTLYSMRASHVFDTIIKHLHMRRKWAIGWITFGLQNTWRLNNGPDGLPNTADDRGLKHAADYQPLMRYFNARYGAYYNYFMWSPFWEMREMEAMGDPTWETSLSSMMTYLRDISSWPRLQGAHDQARTYWEGWQSILPRQSPSRSTIGAQGVGGVNGNHRMGYANAYAEGVWDGGVNYPNVIIGTEDIWEYCSGNFGKPRNALEVLRGLMGGLFANVLPMYDELVEFDPPLPASGHGCNQPGAPGLAGVPGLGNGSGEFGYRAMLDVWYGLWPGIPGPNYRHNSFLMLNHLTSSGSICSGIEGQEYVLFRQGGGTMTINLTSAPGTFTVRAVNTQTGALWGPVNVTGGGVLSAPSPFGAADTYMILKKVL